MKERHGKCPGIGRTFDCRERRLLLFIEYEIQMRRTTLLHGAYVEPCSFFFERDNTSLYQCPQRGGGDIKIAKKFHRCAPVVLLKGCDDLQLIRVEFAA